MWCRLGLQCVLTQLFVADTGFNPWVWAQTIIAQPMRALADAALTTVQTALEPAAFAEAFAAGQQMTLADAFATILAPTPSPGVPISLFHL